MTEEAKKLVGNNYVVAFDLGNGRSIQVNGNFYTDDTEADMNRKLDTLVKVLERQRARAEIEVLELELKTRRKRLDEIDFHILQTQAQLDALASKQRKAPGDENSRTQLLAALENHKLNRKRMEPEIEDGIRAVEDVKRKAA